MHPNCGRGREEVFGCDRFGVKRIHGQQNTSESCHRCTILLSTYNDIPVG